MSNRLLKIELPPEAEPARDFIEQLVAGYETKIAELTQQIESLRAQLEESTGQSGKLTPRNSSVPPSSTYPHTKPERKRTSEKKRKQGGQKGHSRHLRELIPSEQCLDVISCHPTECRRCGGELQSDAGEPTRHQVWELPPIVPQLIEYLLHPGFCPCCGITTQARLRADVPTGQCGPRLAAFVGLLMGHFRQSKQRAASFLEDLLNIPCSPAWTVKIQNRVSDALATPYQELRDALNGQKQLFVDESPTKEKTTKAWLWVVVAPLFAVFGIFANRIRESLVSLIGDYKGIILNIRIGGQHWCGGHSEPITMEHFRFVPE